MVAPKQISDRGRRHDRPVPGQMPGIGRFRDGKISGGPPTGGLNRADIAKRSRSCDRSQVNSQRTTLSPTIRLISSRASGPKSSSWA